MELPANFTLTIFLTYLKYLEAFAYSSGLCPKVSVYDKAVTNESNFFYEKWYEYARYTDPVYGEDDFTDICTSIELNFLTNELYFGTYRIFDSSSFAVISIAYNVLVNEESDWRSIKLQIQLLQTLFRKGDYTNITIETAEQFNLSIIGKGSDWIVWWGCDQLNQTRNRQSLHILGKTYLGNKKIESILNQTANKIPILTTELMIVEQNDSVCAKYNQEYSLNFDPNKVEARMFDSGSFKCSKVNEDLIIFILIVTYKVLTIV